MLVGYGMWKVVTLFFIRGDPTDAEWARSGTKGGQSLEIDDDARAGKVKRRERAKWRLRRKWLNCVISNLEVLLLVRAEARAQLRLLGSAGRIAARVSANPAPA